MIKLDSLIISFLLYNLNILFFINYNNFELKVRHINTNTHSHNVNILKLLSFINTIIQVLVNKKY